MRIKRDTGLVFFLLLVLVFVVSLPSFNAQESNSTVMISYNETSVISGNSTESDFANGGVENTTIMNESSSDDIETANMTERETIPFDIEMSQNENILAENDTFVLAINTTIMGVRIYSLTADAFLYLPNGEKIQLNNSNLSSRDSTLQYLYEHVSLGNYSYTVIMYFEDEEYSIGGSFEVKTQEEIDISEQIVNESVNSDDSFENNNITNSLLLEQSVNITMNNSFNGSLNDINNSLNNSDLFDRATFNISQSNETVFQNKNGYASDFENSFAQEYSNLVLFSQFSNTSGLNMFFKLSDSYEYDYGPVLINGTINLQKELLDNETAILELKIYPEENPERYTDCYFDVRSSRTFVCELPSSQIEITKYAVRVGILFNDSRRINETKEFVFDQFFELKLSEEKEISIDVEQDDFVESGSRQLFTLFASDANGALEHADVGLRIVDPDGNIFTSEAEEISPGTYSLEFHGITPGIYHSEFFVVKGTRYKSIETQYRILEKNINVMLDVPTQFNHTYGTLNVTGTVRLTKNDEFYANDIDIKISTETGLKSGCVVYCDGYCEFSCSLENNIEFTTYNITATLFDDLVAYSDSKEFTVDFSVSNITLDIIHSDSYYIEEEEIFLVKPLVYDDYLLDDGVVFAEITDPDGISYKFSGDEVDDGYTFSFYGITPGNYSVNVTFIQDGFYATKIISYVVKNESYYTVVSDERDVVERNRKKAIREVLHEKTVLDFVKENLTEKYIQLPVRVGEPVAWIKLSKGKKVIFNKRISNLKNERLLALVEKHIDTKQSYDIEDFITTNVSNVILDYLETERVRRSEFPLARSKKEIRILSNYNYTNIFADDSLEDIGEAPKDKIILTHVINGTRIPVQNITYYDDNGNGLIDRIGWFIPDMSKQEEVFEVEVLIDNVSFALQTLETVNQYELARFKVKFRNPDVDVLTVFKQGNGCVLDIDGLQHEMIPDEALQIFELPYEFTEVGTKKYKIFCGDSVQKSQIIILPANDLVLKRSDVSKSYFYDDLHYVSEVKNDPFSFVEQGIRKEIDPNFIPQIDSQDEIYYKVDRGLYKTKLRDLNKTFPFTYSYGIADINFSLKGLAYYNIQTMNYTLVLNCSLNSKPIRNKNQVFYKDIFPNSDLTFTYEPTKLKEELQLSNSLILPTPESMGYDSKDTYLVLLYDLDLGSLVLDQQVTMDKLFIRTVGYEDVGITLSRDTYAPQSSPEQMQPMLRIIQKPDALFKYMTGMPISTYLHANESLIIDPTFTIAPTDRDAMSVNNQTKTDYYDVSSPYLFIGVNGTETYKAGLQFAIDLPGDATITSAYITIVPGTNTSGGIFTSNISIEDADTTQPYSVDLDNITNRTYWSTKKEWTLEVWSTSSNYSTPNLADLIQHVIDRPGWSSGNYIGFMIDEGNATDAYRSFHDYSSPGTNSAVLTIVYLSNESRPVIELQTPYNDTKTRDTTINFTFVPTDPEGLDECQLWANFTGSWTLQSTISNPVNASTNTFENIAVPDGDFIWNVWCNDTMGNYRFNTSDYELFVDSKEPIITLSNPVNSSLISDFDIVFNWTIDDVSQNLTCNLSYYDILTSTLFFENNIFSTNHNVTTYIAKDTPVGYYIWNVTCVDLLNNSNISQTWTFNISRNTTLEISSDVETEMNYTIYQNISFYANYSLANGTSIDDGVCTISFNDSVSDTMIYSVSSKKYEFIRDFIIPYNYSYNVTCVQNLYDSQTRFGAFYIYPLINATIEKTITRYGINEYNVTLLIRNRLNTSAYVTAYDFIHTAFTPQFAILPNETHPVNGGFFGTSYLWEYFLGADEQKRIVYNLTANINNFYVHKLYVVGLSSVTE